VNRKQALRVNADSEHVHTAAPAPARVPHQQLQQPAAVRSLHDAHGLSVEICSSVNGLLALRPEYERLQRTTSNTLPFLMHEWHVAWCNQFLKVDKKLQSQLHMYVVYNRAGRCLGLVPFIASCRQFGPFKVRHLDLIGSDPAITEIRGALVEPGYELSVARAVRQKLREEREFSWVRWGGIAGAFIEALAAGEGADLTWDTPKMDYVLDLPKSWDELRAGFKRNVRESLRHCYNSLKRDGLQFKLEIAEDPERVRVAICRFLTLHAMRARRSDTTWHGDLFASAVAQRFIHEVTQRFAERGAIRVFQLVIGNQVVASRIGFVVGSSLYLYYSGYDPKWSKYSVMTTTVAEAIKYAIAQGLSTVNLSPGSDVSKTRWSPRELPIAQVTQVFPSLTSRLAWGCYRRATAHPRRYAWLRMLAGRAKHQWR
jgi:CelD/BcsL family acetyltransferase involved in cellulose biosynthesis